MKKVGEKEERRGGVERKKEEKGTGRTGDRGRHEKSEKKKREM